MLLSDLLTRAGLPGFDGEREITNLTEDSRTVVPGSLFAALSGTRTDGSRYINDAVKGGASAILVSPDTKVENVPQSCAVIRNAHPRHSLALIAAAFFGPQPRTVVGVTGTNGKTSTVDFLRQLWTQKKVSAASLGTLGVIAPVSIDADVPSMTTLDSVTLTRVLSELAQKHVEHVALEASSHGLDQSRLDGVSFSAAGFTNLTRDHLDYHVTMDAYRDAKLRLFRDNLPEKGLACALSDMDQVTLLKLRETAKARSLQLRLVGTGGDAISLLCATPTTSGQHLALNVLGSIIELDLPLVGRFQVDNALLAAGLASNDDNSLSDYVQALSTLRGVRGRMERAHVLSNGAVAYVDYAHTPDALERLLLALRPHAGRGKIVVVFGAGGDRDRGKRPLMGEIATRLADIAIVTDDNPRTENAQSIRAEIMAAANTAIEIGDRTRAIAEGLGLLKPGDILVVAGKGHEQGQIIGKTVHPFDDCSIIRELAGAA